ncbi:DinB family protein [Gottfriedia acidiceleris]|uniref:DinB family protein n=2 Tax=Gottfriedia acidiceleris TaxID=371036 RepID=UPI002FFF4996
MKENIQIREELMEVIDSLTDEQLNKKVKKEKWTIMQVLEHLYLMESKLVKLMTRTFNEAPCEVIQDKPIHLATDRTKKVPSPPHFEPTDQFITKMEMTEKLNQSRKSLFHFVELTKGQNLEDKGMPHPLFGQINLKQWIPFIGIHEKRHIEQIRELKNAL